MTEKYREDIIIGLAVSWRKECDEAVGLMMPND
jgi:hypothetical protein